MNQNNKNFLYLFGAIGASYLFYLLKSYFKPSSQIPRLANNTTKSNDEADENETKEEISQVVKEDEEGIEKIEKQVKAKFDEKHSEGLAYFKKKEFEKAIESFNEAINLFSSLPEDYQLPSIEIGLYNNRSAAHEKLKQFDLALQDCAFVLSFDPRHMKTYNRRARIYEELGKLKDALRELCIVQRIQVLSGQKSEQSELMQAILTRLADEILPTILQNQKRQPSGKYTKQKSLMLFPCLKQLILSAKKFNEEEINQKIQEEENKKLKASHYFKKSLVQVCKNDFVNAKLTIKEGTNCYEQYEENKNIEEEDTSISHNIALMFALLGIFQSLDCEFEESFQSFEKSLLLEPDNIDIITMYAICSAENDKPKASKLFEKADLNPQKNADFYFHRAQFYSLENDIKNALKDLEISLNLDPSNSYAKALSFQLEIQAAEQSSDHSKIEGILNEIMEETNDPDMLALKAHVYLMQGDFDQALACGDKVSEIEPDNPMPYILRGQFFMQTQDHTQSLQNFERALELDRPYEVLLSIGQLKISTSKDLEETESCMDYFREAILVAPSEQEKKIVLIHLVITEANISAARCLGLTTLGRLPM